MRALSAWLSRTLSRLVAGAYEVTNIPRRSMSVRDFRLLAESKQYAPPKCAHDPEALERLFWLP